MILDRGAIFGIYDVATLMRGSSIFLSAHKSRFLHHFEVELTVVCWRFCHFCNLLRLGKTAFCRHGALQFIRVHIFGFECMDFMLFCVLFTGFGTCFVLRTRKGAKSCLFGEYFSSFHLYFLHLAVSPCPHNTIKGLVNRIISELCQNVRMIDDSIKRHFVYSIKLNAYF